MPDTVPRRQETDRDDTHPATVSVATATAAAAARAVIEAALARHGESVRAQFWRAVDRCYAAPYCPPRRGKRRQARL